MTLDDAQSLYRECPNKRNALAYLGTAFEYAYDYMIGLDEYEAIALELKAWLRSR